MKCKVCGTENEAYLEYCKNCAAPLTADAEPGAAAEDAAPRNFVRSPKWVKPEFNANTISEEDIASVAKPAAQPEQPAAPAFQQPAAPAYQQPAAPAYQQPAAPAYQQPAAPVYQQPAAPVYQQPATPAYQQPATPAYQQPATGTVCLKCGASIPAGQRFCTACGTPIQTVGSSTSAWSGAAAAAQGGAPTVSSAQWAGSTTSTTSWVGASGSPAADYAAKPKAQPSRAAAPQQKKAPAAKRVGGGRSPRPAAKRGGLNTKLLAMIGGGVVVLGLLIFGVIQLINGGLFSKSAITDPPLVEQTTTSTGDPAYNVTIYARKNSVVKFVGGSIEHEETITGKSITFSIPEQVWVPTEPVEGNTIDVYPDITVTNKKGESEAVTFDQPIVISVPSIEMTVTTPATPELTVNAAAIDVAGTVGDTTASVFVNDQQVTVDETGAFTLSYTLPQSGVNTVNVEARKNGYAINRQTFSVDYSTTAPATTTPGGGASTSGDTSAAKSIYFANTADVNVRGTASATGEKVGSLALCDKVFVVSADANEWYQIIYNGSAAYVSGAYITKVSDVSAYAPTAATINGTDVNVRAKGSSDGEKITTLPNGTAVSLIKQDANGWSQIEYNGKIMFVATQYVK